MNATNHNADQGTGYPKTAFTAVLLIFVVLALLFTGCVTPTNHSPEVDGSAPEANTGQQTGGLCAPSEPTQESMACQPATVTPPPTPAIITPAKSKAAVKSKGNFSGGKKHGQWMYWDDLGNKHRRGQYLRGKRHGKWIAWNSDGVKTRKGHYRHGKKHGQWVYRNTNKMRIVHYEDGRKVRDAKYINKHLKRERCWDATSKRMACA